MVVFHRAIERIPFELPIWFDHEALHAKPTSLVSVVFPAGERHKRQLNNVVDMTFDMTAHIRGFRLEVIFDESPDVVTTTWDRFFKSVSIEPTVGARIFPAYAFVPWECSHCQAKHGLQAAQREELGGILLTAHASVIDLVVLARQHAKLTMRFDDPDPFYCVMLRVVVIGTMIRDLQ